MVDRVYQRNTSDSAPQPPTDPSTGYPTGGNPAQGVPATIPGPYWYHMITESLRRVVVEAGLTPDHEDLGLVVSALSRLTARNVTTITSADSPKALTVAEAGLVLVDATNGAVSITLPSAVSNPGVSYRIVRTDSADANAVTITPDGTDTIGGASSLKMVVGDRRTLECDGGSDWKRPEPIATESEPGMLPLSSEADAQALSSLTKLLTPGRLASAFTGGNQSLDVTGYQHLPGNLIIQWGTVTYSDIAGDTAITFKFPIAFPTAILNAQATPSNGSQEVTMRLGTIGSPTDVGCRIYEQDTQNAAGSVNFFVIGY